MSSSRTSASHPGSTHRARLLELLATGSTAARPAGPTRDTPPGGNAAGGRDRGRPGRVPLVRGDRGVGDRPAAWGAGGPRRVGRVPAGEVVPAAAVRPGRRRRPGPGPRGVDVHPYRRTGRAAGDRDRRQNGPRRPHRERGGPASGRRPGPHHRQPGTPSWGSSRSPRRATRSPLYETCSPPST